MSRFIAEQFLNGEQLTDETINLVLEILKNQYSSWNGFEDTTLGPIRQHSHHKKNLSKYFTLIITGQLCVGKSLNEVFMLSILVVA